MAPILCPLQYPFFPPTWIFSSKDSPEIGEPFDKLKIVGIDCVAKRKLCFYLRSVVLVKLHIGEVAFEYCAARVALVEEHKFGFAQMHMRQLGPVKGS